MFRSKGCNKKADKIHERLLKLKLNDYESTPNGLFSPLNKKATHQCCINLLFTKIHKYLDSWLPHEMDKLSLLFAPKSLRLAQFKCM